MVGQMTENSRLIPKDFKRCSSAVNIRKQRQFSRGREVSPVKLGKLGRLLRKCRFFCLV